jgi:DNA-binding MarR family transcriptional regulator
MADIYSRPIKPLPGKAARKALGPIMRRPQGTTLSGEDAAAPSGQDAAASLSEDARWFIEALFLAYRDFIGEPDRILAEIGFGRAHHRVLYFVDRYPGMRVADLLEILQITKQSLARVLRELVRENYIRQISGQTDRRERRLYSTDKGTALAMRLTELQLDKVRKALGAVGQEGRVAVATFFQHMAPDASQLAVLRNTNAVQDAGDET